MKHRAPSIRPIALIAVLAAVATTGCAASHSVKPTSLSHAPAPPATFALPSAATQPLDAPPVPDPNRYQVELVNYQRQQASNRYEDSSPRDANCNFG